MPNSDKEAGHQPLTYSPSRAGVSAIHGPRSSYAVSHEFRIVWAGVSSWDETKNDVLRRCRVRSLEGRQGRCEAQGPQGPPWLTKGFLMARGDGGSVGGIGLGGILVIVGIVLAIVWSLWVGVIVALVGLIAFGGFARGRWY
jgi:hypothetical protein